MPEEVPVISQTLVSESSWRRSWVTAIGGFGGVVNPPPSGYKPVHSSERTQGEITMTDSDRHWEMKPRWC